jgi:hypothetical protein
MTGYTDRPTFFHLAAAGFLSRPRRRPGGSIGGVAAARDGE